MKNQFKKQSFIGLIIFSFLFLFINCKSNDEQLNIIEHQNVSKTIIKNVTLDEIPKIAQFLENNIGNDLKVNLKVSEIYNTREPDVSISINTDEIKQVENTDEISNYSFGAKYEESNQEIV